MMLNTYELITHHMRSFNGFEPNHELHPLREHHPLRALDARVPMGSVNPPRATRSFHFRMGRSVAVSEGRQGAQLVAWAEMVK